MKSQSPWLQVWRQSPPNPSGSRATAEVSRSSVLCTQADQKPSTLPKLLAQSCATCSLGITKLRSRHYRRVTERASGASLPTSRSRNELEVAAKKRAMSMSMRAHSNATEHSRDVFLEPRDLNSLPHGLVLAPSRATNEPRNERTSNGIGTRSPPPPAICVRSMKRKPSRARRARGRRPAGSLSCRGSVC